MELGRRLRISEDDLVLELITVGNPNPGPSITEDPTGRTQVQDPTECKKGGPYKGSIVGVPSFLRLAHPEITKGIPTNTHTYILHQTP